MGKAVGALAVVQILAFAEFGVVKVQVHEVAVKLDLGAIEDTHGNEDNQGADEPFVAVPGKVVDALDERETVRALEVNLLRLQEVGQEDEGE